jgi:uncharacterized membrane protein
MMFASRIDHVLALTAIGAGIWLGLVLVAPLLPTPVAGLVYLAGSLICHQLPERSFHVGAAQLPICARCVGIYLGAAAVLSFTCGASRLFTRGARRVRLAPRSFLIIGAAPTLATLLVEWSGVSPVSNAMRCGAGVFLGAAVAVVVARARLHYDSCVPQRPIAPRLPSTPT